MLAHRISRPDGSVQYTCPRALSTARPSGSAGMEHGSLSASVVVSHEEEELEEEDHAASWEAPSCGEYSVVFSSSVSDVLAVSGCCNCSQPKWKPRAILQCVSVIVD